MKYIKTLILSNVQKHSHLVIDLTSGVNIIIGKSGIGKSAIVRALTWLLYNEPKGDIIRKEGTKETSVKVFYNDGTEIEKIKSKTKNLYILTKPNQEPVEYNAIGKEIPQDIIDVTGVKPIEVDNKSIIINIDKQTAMPFLVDESGSFRMKLFNQLTGYDKIDYTIQNINKDLLEWGRGSKDISERIEKTQSQLSTIIDKQSSYEIEIDNLQTLSNKIDRYNKIKDLYDKWTVCSLDKELLKAKIIEIRPLDLSILKAKITAYNILLSLKERLNKVKANIKSILLKPISILNLGELKNKIETFYKMQQLKSNQVNLEKQRLLLIKQQEQNFLKLEEWKKKKIEWIKNNKICPLSKTSLSDKCLKGIMGK